MTGARAGWVRVVAMGLALAVTMLLFAAREAGAAKYAVAQCGWHLDSDATWADTTGGAKFRPDAWCATPVGSDPFAGAHVKSFTRGAETVSGTRFARWRWQAPPGGSITRVTGTWWHALHDGLEHRIGAGTWSGGFSPFGIARSTDTALHDFVAGFSGGVPAIESRLLCARGEGKWCSLAPGSWSGVRALTLTVEDGSLPGAGIGGELRTGGWLRGRRSATIWGADTVSGIRYGETYVDGSRVALTEYGCAIASIGGEWRGARMSPCSLGVSATQSVETKALSDGTHTLYHCVVDFAGNRGCGTHYALKVDNNPPAAPRRLALAGEGGWRRVNDFDFSWSNPGQGDASPIDGAFWQIVGPGYDSGTKLERGRDVEDLANRTAPRSGVYELRVWLRDEAGNSTSSASAEAPMKLDYVAPGVAFDADESRGRPELPGAVAAEVIDEHSGPAKGEIRYRRLGGDRWLELPTALREGEKQGTARLVAAIPPDLAAGTYVFRAEAVDRAGNGAASTRRADGTQMALRKLPPARPAAGARVPPAEARAKAAPRARTRIFARLRQGRRRGRSVTVAFGAGAFLSGRLLTAEGAGLAGRTLRVVSRFSRGSFRARQVETARSGRRGGFRLSLRPGPSRRIAVRFRGAAGLAPARRAGMALRVRGGISLGGKPLALRTGEAVRLWGRLRSRGAPLPRRGKLIAIQYYERGARRWRPVLFTRSDHDGRFRARYRFRYVSGSARIRLRAVALAEERWPYAPGASEPLTVRVSG